jgi:glutathione S-transferase
VKLQLYYAPSTCATAPYINLTEAAAEFDVRPLNPRKQQNRTPDYLALNPMHKVPTLIVDGQIITENVAIQVWIARNFPSAALLPTRPIDEIRAISLMAWFASEFHPHLSRVNSQIKYCEIPSAAGSIRDIAVKMLLENFRIADDLLAGRDFFFDRYTVVDGYFFWCVRRAIQLEISLAALTNCVAHLERMRKRASVQKLLSYEAEVQKEFART